MVVLAEIKTFFTALANHLVGVGRQGGVGCGEPKLYSGAAADSADGSVSSIAGKCCRYGGSGIVVVVEGVESNQHRKQG
jgi:hypothetical protein